MIAAPPYPYQIEARHELQESELFLIRIWRPIAGGFRASARRMEDEETRYFSQPDEVARFLVSAVESKAHANDAEPLPAARDVTP